MRTGQRPPILSQSPARESACSKVDLPLHRSGFRIVQPADARFPSFRNWPFSAFPLRTEKIGGPAKRTAPLIDILREGSKLERIDSQRRNVLGMWRALQENVCSEPSTDECRAGVHQWSGACETKLTRKRARVGVLRSTLHSVTRCASSLAARTTRRGRRFSNRRGTSHESTSRRDVPTDSLHRTITRQLDRVRLPAANPPVPQTFSLLFLFLRFVCLSTFSSHAF